MLPVVTSHFGNYLLLQRAPSGYRPGTDIHEPGGQTSKVRLNIRFKCTAEGVIGMHGLHVLGCSSLLTYSIVLNHT